MGLSDSSAAEIYVPIDSGADNPLIGRDSNGKRATRKTRTGRNGRAHQPERPTSGGRVDGVDRGSERTASLVLFGIVSLFAFLSVAVSIVGVCGAVAQVVALRAREMVIRVALGARPSTVVWLVMRQGRDRPRSVCSLARSRRGGPAAVFRPTHFSNRCCFRYLPRIVAFCASRSGCGGGLIVGGLGAGSSGHSEQSGNRAPRTVKAAPRDQAELPFGPVREP